MIKHNPPTLNTLDPRLVARSFSKTEVAWLSEKQLMAISDGSTTLAELLRHECERRQMIAPTEAEIERFEQAYAKSRERHAETVARVMRHASISALFPPSPHTVNSAGQAEGGRNMPPNLFKYGREQRAEWERAIDALDAARTVSERRMRWRSAFDIGIAILGFFLTAAGILIAIS